MLSELLPKLPLSGAAVTLTAAVLCVSAATAQSAAPQPPPQDGRCIWRFAKLVGGPEKSGPDIDALTGTEDQDGNICVVVSAANRIALVAPEKEKFVSLVKHGLRSPRGLAMSPDFHTLYVADTEHHQVKKLTLDVQRGHSISVEEVETVMGSGNERLGLAGITGDAYNGDRDPVTAAPRDPRTVNLARPTGLALRDDVLLVVDRDHGAIRELNLKTNVVRTVLPDGSLHDPLSVAFASGNELYCTGGTRSAVCMAGLAADASGTTRVGGAGHGFARRGKMASVTSTGRNTLVINDQSNIYELSLDTDLQSDIVSGAGKSRRYVGDMPRLLSTVFLPQHMALPNPIAALPGNCFAIGAEGGDIWFVGPPVGDALLMKMAQKALQYKAAGKEAQYQRIRAGLERWRDKKPDFLMELSRDGVKAERDDGSWVTLPRDLRARIYSFLPQFGPQQLAMHSLRASITILYLDSAVKRIKPPAPAKKKQRV